MRGGDDGCPCRIGIPEEQGRKVTSSSDRNSFRTEDHANGALSLDLCRELLSLIDPIFVVLPFGVDLLDSEIRLWVRCSYINFRSVVTVTAVRQWQWMPAFRCHAGTYGMYHIGVMNGYVWYVCEGPILTYSTLGMRSHFRIDDVRLPCIVSRHGMALYMDDDYGSD